MSSTDDRSSRDTATVPEVSAEDRAADVLRGWQAALVAAGPPDTLLAASPNAPGWLELTHAHPSGLAQLLAGRPTRLSSLVREPAAHAAARHRARTIRTLAEDLAAERGILAGFLAAGVATWRPPSVARGDDVLRLDALTGPVSAPVLLRGCALRPRGPGHEDYDLDLGDTAVVNPELVRRLAGEYGITLDGELLGALAFGPGGFDPRPVFERIEQLCTGVVNLRIERRLVVGSFTAGPGALVADLQQAAVALPAHPVLGPFLRRDPEDEGTPVRDAPRTLLPGVDGSPLAVPMGRADRDPTQETLVLDLDPAQQRALDVALGGGTVVLEGPPGSGLTHTLAAITAALVAEGRRILVLTPRRATAEAFLARLAGCGLAELALDLQDGTGDRRRLLAVLGARLEQAASGQALRDTIEPAEVTTLRHETLRRSRATLLSASEALHAVREPWGVSAYEAMVALADLMRRRHAPRTTARLSPQALVRLDGTERERLRGVLHEAAEAGAFTLTRTDTRWLDARIASEQDVDSVLAAARTARDMLATARAAMAGVSESAGLILTSTASQWAGQLELLLGVRETLDVLLPAAFEQPLAELAVAVSDGPDPQHGALARHRLRRRARGLVRPGVHLRELTVRLRAAEEQRQRWREQSVAERGPCVPPGLAEAGLAVTAVLESLAVLGRALAGTNTPELTELGFEELNKRLIDLAGDEEGLRAQPHRTALLDELRTAGLGPLLKDLRERTAGPEDVDGELDLAWWTSVLDAVVRDDPRLARHDGAQLRRTAATLRLADREHISDGGRRVRAALARRAEDAVREHPDQVRWLQAEVHRGHRSQWPADLFRRAGDLVGALQPIWIMSPDAVARVLPPPGPACPVDAVVVDDAGTVALPEAVAALARGRQVVVAGDRRRLPPEGGMASVLDAVAEVTGHVHRLDRDHRACDGRMLAPVLRRYPEGWVVTPGTSVTPRLRLVHVPNGVGVPGPGEEIPVSAEAEVEQVIDLVEEHARHRPHRSLMVVALGERHAERIEEALRSEVAGRPELAAWLEERWTGQTRTGFLVRSAHRVAGLERDEVIVAVGLARTPHRRVLHRFGVLDSAAGAGALTTALTRARLRTTVVCCFTSEELDPDRVRSDGAQLLRDVLRIAEPGGTITAASAALSRDLVVRAGGGWASASRRSGHFGGRQRGNGCDALVGDLQTRLAAVGVPVQAGVGDPAWPVDLALGDPRRSGRMLVAIDLDGPAHAARPSVRERDRQRQDRLERAGWVYCRVAAMDLFLDPDAEVERIRAIWAQAVGAR